MEMENEIMRNEEVIEEYDTDVETVVEEDDSVLKTAGIGLGILAGGFALYKFAVKPLIAKIKAKKNPKAAEAKDVEFTEVDFDDLDDGDYFEEDED